MNKRRILLLAVVLGVLLGTGLALLNLNLPPSTSTTSTASVQCPTSVVQKVVEDSAQTIADKPVVATNIATKVQPPEPPKPPKPPKPSNPPKPVTYLPHVPKARQVLLANRRIVVEEGRSFPKTFCAAQTPTARGTAPYIVISEKPVNRDVRIQAVANGAKVIGFLPNNALLVEADAEALKNLEEDATFLAAVEYEPTDKIQRRVLEADTPSIETTIVLLNEKDRETVIQFVTSSGGKMIDGTPAKGKAIMAEVPSTLVTDLAGKAEVKWIEKHLQLKLNNDQAVLPQVMNVTPVWNTHGLTGDGQIIAILDSGIDKGSKTDINADFAGQIVEIAPFSDGDLADHTGHGTHTAGSIAGTGANSSGQFKGVAYGAKLLFQSGGNHNGAFNPYGVTSGEAFTYGLAKWHHGVRSDSWGASGSTWYDEYCVACDTSIWNNPELLEVVAAGNEGGFYSPDATIDTPACSKNSLAVGSTRNRRYTTKDTPSDAEIYDISTYSSLGPTYDGRIKPDICAPGEYVVSVASSRSIYGSYFDKTKNYAYDSGTSMATPLTAGCAALVREWLMKHKGYSETKPTAALMKAILTGGAFDIKDKAQNGWLYGKCPSMYQGWGRVDLEASIFPTNGLAVYMKDRLPFKSNETFAFTVTTTNAASLRAQLVWIDYPAEEESEIAIINDLDLTVSSTASGEKKTYFGNGGTTKDELNTVESVRIENAVAGTYKVKVTCPKIPYDYTEGGAAAIYIRGAFDPESVFEGTEAQLAAQKSPSKPVLLVDAGVSTKPDTKDNWLALNASGSTSYSISDGSVVMSSAIPSGKFWPDGTAKEFSPGAFSDLYGATWGSVEEEMLVSLGLRGTKETDLNEFFKTCIHVGTGAGSTITISGLDKGKRYVMHYMTCDQNNNNKSGSFKLKTGGYSGMPVIQYVRGDATSYSDGEVGTAVKANPDVPLLVRVSNLRPNAQGKVVIDVGGATINLLAIAEMPPAPSLFYLARHRMWAMSSAPFMRIW